MMSFHCDDYMILVFDHMILVFNRIMFMYDHMILVYHMMLMHDPMIGEEEINAVFIRQQL